MEFNPIRAGVFSRIGSVISISTTPRKAHNFSAGNANYIAQLESIIAAQDQAARDQADLSAAAGRAAAEINQARADADHAATLAAQRKSNEIAAADRQVAAFEAGGGA